MSSPPGWWLTIELGDDELLDVPVVGWDADGPFSWHDDELVRGRVFHEAIEYRRRGPYRR